MQNGWWQNEKRGMMTSSILIVLLHDNARPHTAACTEALLKHFNWDLSDHPPYSPDPTLSDYHLFTYLTNWLRSQHFNNNQELTEGIKNVVELTYGRLLWHRHTKTYSRHEKCLSSSGDYVEKLLKYVFLVYNNIFFLIAFFVNSSPMVTFQIPLI
jgi:hypothetical protein